MEKTGKDGKAGLLTLAFWYALSYTGVGVAIKYCLSHGVGQLELLFNSNVAGILLVITTMLFLRWGARFTRDQRGQLAYIIPSGICTAFIIPTTTLMYTLPVSVMVAQVLMRSSVIVSGRIIDTIQIRQGIMKKQVVWEENAAMFFALLAAATIFFKAGSKDFRFFQSLEAMTVMAFYIVPYAIRLYIMNYYKHGIAERADNKAFFAAEQIFAALSVLAISMIFFSGPQWFGWQEERILKWSQSTLTFIALLAGIPFGLATFFSVFIFLYPGTTATFATLTNRLTSLVGGTAATLILWLGFDGKFPNIIEWLSLMLILVSIGFLWLADRHRGRNG